MLSQLVRRIDLGFNGELPKEYVRLLTNISKPTSVAGLLQFAGPAALKHLGDLANQTLDLRLRNSRDTLNVVQKELPVFWHMLLDVLDLEKTNFLSNATTGLHPQIFPTEVVNLPILPLPVFNRYTQTSLFQPARHNLSCHSSPHQSLGIMSPCSPIKIHS